MIPLLLILLSLRGVSTKKRSLIAQATLINLFYINDYFSLDRSRTAPLSADVAIIA